MLVTTLLMISLENSAETWESTKEKRNFFKKRHASQNGSHNKTAGDNANIDDVETGKFRRGEPPTINQRFTLQLI